MDDEIGRFLLSAGYHDTTIEDAIGNAVPWSRHYENLGDLESYGYSLGFTYNGEQLTRYAYDYSGTSTGDTLSIDTSYQLSSSVDVGWIATVVQDLNDVYVVSSDATIDKPGYDVHDFYAHWQPQGVDGLSLTLTVKNAFNKEYLDHGSVEDFTGIAGYTGIVGYPAPGRDVRVSLAYRF